MNARRCNSHKTELRDPDCAVDERRPKRNRFDQLLMSIVRIKSGQSTSGPIRDHPKAKGTHIIRKCNHWPVGLGEDHQVE